MNNFEANRKKLKKLKDEETERYEIMKKIENEMFIELKDYILENDLLNENDWELVVDKDGGDISLKSYEDYHPKLIKIIRKSGLDQFAFNHFMIVLINNKDNKFKTDVDLYYNDGDLRIKFCNVWNKKEQYKIFDFINLNNIPISYQNIEDNIKEYDGKVNFLRKIVDGNKYVQNIYDIE